MRTVLAFLLLVGSGVTQVSAQAGGNNAVQRITQSLSLTQAQVDLVNENLDERNPGTMWTRFGRDATLGLSSEQSARLDALDASQSQAGARGTLSPEMSALLTPAQLELAQLHRGPTRAMRGGRGR